MLNGALSSVAGTLALLTLSLCGTIFLTRLPFSIISAGTTTKKIPRGVNFWFLESVAFMISMWIFATCLIALGPDEIGFGIAGPKPFINWQLKAWLGASLIVLVLFGLNFLVRREEGQKFQRWFDHAVLAIAYSYLLTVFLAAYFRAQSVNRIGYDFFLTRDSGFWNFETAGIIIGRLYKEQLSLLFWSVTERPCLDVNYDIRSKSKIGLLHLANKSPHREK